MDLEGVATELYRLTPAQFTAARNARASEIGAAGDRGLAGEIRKLPKPSAQVWAVNSLAGEDRAVKAEFADLGDELRAVLEHPDREALAALNDRRRKLVAKTRNAAVEVAEAAGVQLSASAINELEQTLFAAVVDARAAAAAFSGRLIRTLQPIGFDDVDLDGAVAGAELVLPKMPKSKEKSGLKSKAGSNPKRKSNSNAKSAANSVSAQRAEKDLKREQERKKLVARAERAAARLAQAERSVEQLDKRLRDTEQEAETAVEDVKELEAKVCEALRRQADLLERLEELHNERDGAELELKTASGDAEEVEARLNARDTAT